MNYKATLIGLGYNLNDEFLTQQTTALKASYVLNLREINQQDLNHFFPAAQIIDLSSKPEFLEKRVDSYRKTCQEIFLLVEKYPGIIIPVIGDPFCMEGITQLLVEKYHESIRIIRGTSIIDKVIQMFPDCLSKSGLSIVDLSYGLETIKPIPTQYTLLLQYGRVGSKLNTMGYQPNDLWLNHLQTILASKIKSDSRISIINLSKESSIYEVLLQDLQQKNYLFSQETTLLIHPVNQPACDDLTIEETLNRLVTPLEELFQ